MIRCGLFRNHEHDHFMVECLMTCVHKFDPNFLSPGEILGRKIDDKLPGMQETN